MFCFLSFKTIIRPYFADDPHRSTNVQPPPYSDLPPRYDLVAEPTTNDLSRMTPTRNGTRRVHHNNGPHVHVRGDNSVPNHSPPPYISVIQDGYAPTPSTISHVLTIPDHSQTGTRLLHHTESELSVGFPVIPYRSRVSQAGGNHSVSPVTIREISMINQNEVRSNLNDRNDLLLHNNAKRRPKNIVQNRSTASNKQVSDRQNGATSSRTSQLPGSSASPETLWPDSPTPRSATAARRSANRRAVIERLNQRRANPSWPDIPCRTFCWWWYSYFLSCRRERTSSVYQS